MCLDGFTIKVLNYNGLGEDPKCAEQAYPSYSKYPSFIAKTGDCVRVAPYFYVRYQISPTVDPAETENSWDLPDGKLDEGKLTMEQLNDETTMASSCMVNELKELFFDPKCQESMKMDDEESMMKMREAQKMISRGNQIIQSKECEFLDPS